MINRANLLQVFEQKMGGAAELLARAPGRVNLIGEHTDYNGGFVLPAAINREVMIAARARRDAELRVYSLDFEKEISISEQDRHRRVEEDEWVNYVLAVIDQFRKRGYRVPGLNLTIQGDVPLGSGLSSSAALEVAMAVLLDELLNAALSQPELALLAQAAEHSPFVGVQCGIMDQFISATGKTDRAVKINCRTLDYEHVPLDSDTASIVIVDSSKKRGLVDSEYNKRRKECETGFAKIAKLSGRSYESLSDIPPETFREHQANLSADEAKRIRHVLSENQRIHDFHTQLAKKNFAAAGELLYKSHESLRDDFQVSCQELDAIVEIGRQAEGVFGCRMTGAGFGGCAVALVRRGSEEVFRENLVSEYSRQTGLTPLVYVTKPSQGAEVFELGRGAAHHR